LRHTKQTFLDLAIKTATHLNAIRVYNLQALLERIRFVLYKH